MTTSSTTTYPDPAPTASLLLSHRPVDRTLLVVGSSRLAASRVFACLESGGKAIVVGPSGRQGACPEILHRLDRQQIQWRDLPSAASREEQQESWANLLDDVDGGEARNIFAVAVTDTLHLGAASSQPDGDGSSSSSSSFASPLERAELLYRLCRSRRIPINVADQPLLCDFSFPAAHRFAAAPSPFADASSQDKVPSSLQIAVTTNGRGCRLAGRIRREIITALPRNVGDAVDRVGEMREMARQEVRRRSRSRSAAPLPEQLSSEAASQPKAKRPKLVNRTASGTVTPRSAAELDEDDLSFDSTPINTPVPQLSHAGGNSYFRQAVAALAVQAEADADEEAEATRRRMRWVAQISEYWPIEYLGSLGKEQMSRVLETYDKKDQGSAGAAPGSPRTVLGPKAAATSSAPQQSEAATDGSDQSRGRQTSRDGQLASFNAERRGSSQHALALLPPTPPEPSTGHIYLLGSGPGHPGLLTLFAHSLLTSPTTHLVLADKLVPAAILRLIPSTTPLVIAKKFPGNAEGAQSELIALALKGALEEGKTVVRLKQGDPFVYGRGGEEVLAFRKAGVECTVVPGISSSIAAPLMLGIPVTQRGAADSMTLCTGVGRGGKQVRLPGYERNRSTVILMGVARLAEVVQILTKGWDEGDWVKCQVRTSERNGGAYPPETPIAIVERASSTDQRLVASTLGGIVAAIEASGEQRPPGMLLIGWAVLSLEGAGDVSVLDDEAECLAAATTTTAVEDSQGQAQSSIDYNVAHRDLQAKDKARIERWLKGRRCIMREGLDEAYSKALSAFSQSVPLASVHLDGSRPNGAAEGAPPGAALEQHGAVDKGAAQQIPPLDPSLERATTSLQSRDPSGWAPGRYGAQAPWGGWASGEAPNIPSLDRQRYEADLRYAEEAATARSKGGEGQ